MYNKNSLICLTGIQKDFKNQGRLIKVLHDINLTICKNEFICVIYPSGCGKSTLLKLIAGYIMPSLGECRMHSKLITEPDISRGVVFQSSTLFPWLTVRGNIEYGLKMKRLDKNIISKKSKTIMNKIGLSKFSNAYPFELSGGMRQRVSLARTLINDPELVLMDEPFSSLDATTRDKMQKLVRSLWYELNQTIFLITHDIDEALKLGTRIIVMSEEYGRVIMDKKINYSTKILNNQFYKVETDYKFYTEKQKIFELIS